MSLRHRTNKPFADFLGRRALPKQNIDNSQGGEDLPRKLNRPHGLWGHAGSGANGTACRDLRYCFAQREMLPKGVHCRLGTLHDPALCPLGSVWWLFSLHVRDLLLGPRPGPPLRRGRMFRSFRVRRLHGQTVCRPSCQILSRLQVFISEHADFLPCPGGQTAFSSDLGRA